jgi:hypothetical protein
MTSRTIRQHIGPWLAALFFLVQSAGLVPLIGIHLQHLAETQRDIADDLAAAGAVDHVHSHHADHRHDANRGDGHHDHGADDPADQCCMVHHHFAGVVPAAMAGSLHGYLIVPLVPRPPRLPVEAGRSRLERPPKLPFTV